MDKKGALDAKGGNSFTNFRGPKSEHQKLKDAITFCKMHVICTFRSKQGYLQAEGNNGKLRIQKVGMDLIAEPQIEYEFTTVIDMDMEHQATASKDRTGLFDGQTFQPSPETGQMLMNWLRGGGEGEAAQEPPPPREVPRIPIPPPLSAAELTAMADESELDQALHSRLVTDSMPDFDDTPNEFPTGPDEDQQAIIDQRRAQKSSDSKVRDAIVTGDRVKALRELSAKIGFSIHTQSGWNENRLIGLAKKIAPQANSFTELTNHQCDLAMFQLEAMRSDTAGSR
jgi:hypothetical protein